MEKPWTPRRQGDAGELSAMHWLASTGAYVFYPVGHSPDYDLVADLDDGRLIRVQVKTSTSWSRGRFVVALCTRGGNRSWNRIIKYLDASRCDYVFAHVGDGRRWFIPAEELGGGSSIVLDGPKYAECEIERGEPSRRVRKPPNKLAQTVGGIPERSNGLGCKPSGYAFAGSNPAPAT